ncbi:MbtH family protein [Rugosimonospora africana]|uniref:Protein mbtH n=1 Tax=Rugosimonospora africana TaxID=556532 RepID=A0A8J3R4H3_9ACTN|nr:MbtH family protein [Rugosimonospora africana]GIH21317.1 protein mbtH [Rugosimonospora africana]
MNPFENPDGTYLVLINDEKQYSLWPAFIDVPAGWKSVCGEKSREECINFIEEHWLDMRPASLAEAMDRS